MNRILRIGIVQQANTADVAQNRARLAEAIGHLAGDGAHLVVLQELHDSLYFCQTENPDQFDLAEPIPGPATAFYSSVAQRHGIVLVTSLFERRAAGLYHNTAVVFEADGSIAGRYRKMHIPDDPAYYEKFYFTPGDLGFRPIDTSVGRLGVQDVIHNHIMLPVNGTLAYQPVLVFPVQCLLDFAQRIHLSSSFHKGCGNENDLPEVAAAAQPGDLLFQNSKPAGLGIDAQITVCLAQGLFHDTVSLPDQGLFLRGKRRQFDERACPGTAVEVRIGRVNPLYNEIMLLEARTADCRPAPYEELPS